MNQEINQIEKALRERLVAEDAKNKLLEFANEYKELMAYYRCAIMEVETKFRVLSESLSIRYDRNPIETIKTRLKSPESIVDKLMRYDFPLTVDSIEKNLNDIAGVRVICSFPADIYKLADAFLNQDDVFLITKKDYIQNPKKTGYRSLHLIVETPIFLQNCKRMMKVEVQFRTIAMDWWASAEHKIRYKKVLGIPMEQLNAELAECARLAAELDERMEKIHEKAEAAIAPSTP